MKKEQSFRLLNWIGWGKTKAEAKINAFEVARKSLDGDWKPVLLECGKHRSLIWRGNSGEVVYKYFQTPEQLSAGGGECYGCTTIKEAERAVRINLAQLNMDLDDPTIPDILGGDFELIANYRHWFAWQKAYEQAPDELNSVEKHQWASAHQREFLAA